MYLHRTGKQLFAFAGLWARTRTDAGEQLSFTIVTGPPNELVAPIHDRMPIVLAPSTYAAWLDPALDADGAKALLAVPPVGDWIAEPVSPRVNSAANDDASCIAPITASFPHRARCFPRSAPGSSTGHESHVPDGVSAPGARSRVPARGCAGRCATRAAE